MLETCRHPLTDCSWVLPHWDRTQNISLFHFCLRDQSASVHLLHSYYIGINGKLNCFCFLCCFKIRFQLHLDIRLLIPGFYFIFLFFSERCGMSSALISTYLAVFRLRQEMCNQHLYSKHQKGSFLRSVISGLPGAQAAWCSPSASLISARPVLLKS